MGRTLDGRRKEGGSASSVFGKLFPEDKRQRATLRVPRLG